MCNDLLKFLQIVTCDLKLTLTFFSMRAIFISYLSHTYEETYELP